MIIIKDLLLLFYNFKSPYSLVYDNSYIYYNNSKYFFQKVNKNSINLINGINNPLFHEIIKNKYNLYLTLYNNEYYALLKIKIKENREILFEDIIDISKNVLICDTPKNNYFNMWNSKISFIEKYYNDYYSKEKIDFNYYNGLAYIALNIVNKINYLNITYGISYKRFYNINSLYELYNPFNIEYGPIVDSVTEYIKYFFFYKNESINYELLFNIRLTNDDYYYLIARLLFPTYYYDLFKDNKIVDNYRVISNRIVDYISYIKEIIKAIKKRHNNMSLLDYIINLL